VQQNFPRDFHRKSTCHTEYAAAKRSITKRSSEAAKEQSLVDLGVEKSETQADLLEASAEAPAMGSQRVEIHLPGELLNELLVKIC